MEIILKVLWISLCVPYDSVPHAGGKIHNFYLKKLYQKISDIFLISFFKEREIQKIDLEKYNIKNKLICRDPLDVLSLKSKFLNLFCHFNPFQNTFHCIHSNYVKKAICAINELVKIDYSPNVVILQWTQMGALLPHLRKIWPNAKYVCIEEDVYFLGILRRYREENNPVKKFLCFLDYLKAKRIEKKFLKKADLIILNNYKDEKLLNENCVNSNIWVWTPFFQNMHGVKCRYTGKDILFYGAMSRPENYLSAIWFIKNVFYKLEPLGYHFVVVGNNPHESLKKYDNGNSIQIVGFVDDVSSYFENSLCLVAPLLMGAGVKIKVIEAMSSGLPVLTNDIGIEGIFAEDGNEYFFCKNPDDYEHRIIELAKNAELGRNIGSNAKKFVENNYNFELDAEKFCDKIISFTE